MDHTPTHDTPWTALDAMAFVRAQEASGTKQWEQFCLRLAAHAYGYSASNVKNIDGDKDHDVADYWAQVPAKFKHEDDRKPPLGGLAIFGNPTRFGHIAVVVRSDGRGVVVLANDDVGAKGRVRPLSLTAIERTLKLRYLGWVEPHFPDGAVGNPLGLPQGDHQQTVFRRALAFGNKDSESVLHLQRRLSNLLGIDLPETGAYNAATKRAVKTFQRRCCRFPTSGADGLIWDPVTKSGGKMTTALLFPGERFVVKHGAVPHSDRLTAAATK